MTKKILIVLIISFYSILSQPKESLNSSEIKIALEKLNTLGSVLYIAAHPDDENTAFLTYCIQGKKLRTGYLALTRGDGGQNLIGDEQGDLLGVIRTQELLQARNIDGAEQFFTRAVDFGYSKTPEETFRKWGKQEILSDVVWVIRKFRPDIIITRFPPNGITTHGHHTASAILALEAFKISGDSTAFPEQLKYLKPWKAKRIFWNAWTPALSSMGINSDTLIKINLGAYNELLGKSYTEISAESRSMHKSQGFGASGNRKNYYNYFFQLAGDPAKNDLFDDIDISWKRINGSEDVSSLLHLANVNYDFKNPSNILPTLVKAYQVLQNLKGNYWADIKLKELIDVIKSCAGIWLEAITDENLASPGSELTVKTGLVNRSDFPMTLKSVQVDYQINDSTLNSKLIEGVMISVERKILIPKDAEYSQPYWLKNENHKDTYIVDDQKLIGLPQTDYPIYADFKIDYNGTELDFRTPVFFRENDPVRGEVYKRVDIVPEAVISFEKNLYLIKNGEVKEITVSVKSIKGKLNGKVSLKCEEGWDILPKYYGVDFITKDDEKGFKFYITPTGNSNSSLIKAQIEIGNKILSKSLVTIDYPHIQPQNVLLDAKVKILKLSLLKKTPKKIAYIMGSGDKIPGLLRDLGFIVDVFDKEPLTPELLKNYDVVITGIRAYNTNERLAIDEKNILNYIENGGTVLVQYNTSGNLMTDPSPYKLTISRDRVTEEDSPVKLLDESNPILNYPYKITQKDFDGWVQERGLYFPNEWDNKFEPLLEMNDTGESSTTGSLLVAKYGKGNFIYTGLSFFRQLPAGVEGAYHLFINLISAGISE
ncbi:MAG: PIG-L family deacetylase [Ignavibacteriaceae bacterium]|jgi:LmbE family N-acetylglucosaminyl deacetylase|nr:PIG-L family deacetylase [Ignavibacteriaceae bacterium]